MARSSKSVDTINKNLTKDEIKQRKEAEKATLSGIEIRKSNELKGTVAQKEFERVIEILNQIGKNDAVYEAVINEYCILKSDIARYTTLRKKVEKDLKGVDGLNTNENMKYVYRTKYRSEIIAIDKQIQSLKKRRFEIEKENGMTIASSLRSVPKKVEKKKNKLLGALNGE